jgi:outer membrane protein OmpA-like peptidoglycan-associated protein
MKKILQLFICVFPLSCFAQNLLLNGSFEVENICTEYNVNCAPEAWISSIDGFSDYYKDANRAFDGSHCMGIQVGHAYKPYRRGFIRSRLLCGLRKGSTYRLEFYIKSPHPILDSIGVYFGPNDPLLERKPIHLLAPSLRLIDQGNQFVKDSSWQKARLDYTAAGNEAYITIANFSIKDITGPTGIVKENNFFVYIDRVSLVPLNHNERLCLDWEQTKEEIYDQNERHEYLVRYIPYRRNNPELTRPTPTTIFTADTLLLPDLLFATGKKDLKLASLAVLDSFCTKMGGKIIDSLIIEGHADNTGTVQINEELATGRAEAAANYLAQCGSFFKVPVTIRGWGSRKPVAGNETPQGRQQNRRVELLVYFLE